MSEPTLYRRIIAGQAGAWAAPLRGALRLVALPYAAVIRYRNAHYDRVGPEVTLPVPVVSVGNITVGGTGKTPMVVELVKRLERNGHSPAVVSRGYKSIDGEPNDEELLIRSRCPGVVYVADPDRATGAENAIRHSGADVIVLDDAFQHRRLARDLDMVLIDATCPFGHGHVLPRGLLREPIESLRRADVIVVTRCDQVAQGELERIRLRIQQLHTDVPLIESSHRVTSIERLDGTPVEESVDGKRAVVFAGIGHPRGFLTTVRSLGFEVVGTRWWPDHHRYTTRDIDGLRRTGRFPPHEVLVTTEKDAVKLRRLTGMPQAGLLVVRIDIDFAAQSGRIFDEQLARAVGTKQGVIAESANAES
jgi:tetraacyldisaccharide 4'-kinase